MFHDAIVYTIYTKATLNLLTIIGQSIISAHTGGWNIEALSLTLAHTGGVGIGLGVLQRSCGLLWRCPVTVLINFHGNLSTLPAA